MAFIAPLVGGLAGYGAATAIGLGTVGTVASTAGGALLGASLMSKSKSKAASVPTVPPVAGIGADGQPDGSAPTPPADTGPPPAVPVPPSSTVGTGAGTTSASGGQADYEAALPTASGPADVAAIETMKKGRRSTILTSAQGLLSSQEPTGTLRKRRSLVGTGLLA